MADPNASEPGVRARGWRRAGTIAAATIGVLAGLATIGGFVMQASGAFTAQPTDGPEPARSTAPSPSAPTPTPASLIERAAGLHAGYPEQRFTDLYGGPIASRPLDAGWHEDTFVADGVAAAVVFDPDGDARLYGVLVCDPAEQPRFVTAPQRTVALQSGGIATAEQGADADALNDRALDYVDGGTGGSLGQLLELSVQRPASGNAFTSYIVGINRACADTAFSDAFGPGERYAGSVADAPADLRAYRERTPADFYTQVLGDYTVADDGSLTLSTADGPIANVFASPFVGDLPPELPGLR